MNLQHDAIRLPVQAGPIILNISSKIYGHAVRNGDMIGFCNIIAHLRAREGRRDIACHIAPEAIFDAAFCRQFHQTLLRMTDYLSSVPGSYDLPMHDMWLYRMAAGDYVRIVNPLAPQRKICLFPVFDAVYNSFRNWTVPATQAMIDHFSQPAFAAHEKLFCAIVTPPQINYRDFRISCDFEQNLIHLMQCAIYVGGDTGMSHFAGALDPAPAECIYYLNHSRQHVEALPFHVKTKGRIVLF